MSSLATRSRPGRKAAVPPRTPDEAELRRGLEMLADLPEKERKSILTPYVEHIALMLEKKFSLRDIADWLEKTYGIRPSLSTLHAFIATRPQLFSTYESVTREASEAGEDTRIKLGTNARSKRTGLAALMRRLATMPVGTHFDLDGAIPPGVYESARRNGIKVSAIHPAPDHSWFRVTRLKASLIVVK